MSYLLDRKKRNKKIWNISLIVFSFFVLFYFNNYIFRNFSSLTQNIFRPILVLGNNINIRLDNFSNYFANKNNLAKENSDLKNSNQELLAELVNYKSLEEENISLKELLGRSSTENSYVLATILVKPNVSFFDTLLIDVGEDSNVAEGDLVLAYGNIPIGKIAEVNKNTSKVTLFSSSGEKTNAIISSKNIYVELIGRGGNNFEIILPRDLNLEKDEQIILPGIYPYLLAKVVSIITDERDAYQKALLTSPINIQQLKFVQIRK